MIIDLDFPNGLFSGRAPRKATRARCSSIANDTPLVSRAAAEGVWEEACNFLGEELPVEWIALLTEKAEAVYAHPNEFRRRVRGAGNSVRDWLWAFLRHWLAALIQEHRPRSFAQLPPRYSVGEALVHQC